MRMRSGFLLMSISVATLATVAHEQMHPYASALLDNLVLAGHWQTLLALMVLLINDAGGNPRPDVACLELEVTLSKRRALIFHTN